MIDVGVCPKCGVNKEATLRSINRLRAEVADEREQSQNFYRTMVAVEAERDRLRELLRSLRSVVMEDYRHLIDAALGGEEGKDERR